MYWYSDTHNIADIGMPLAVESGSMPPTASMCTTAYKPHCDKIHIMKIELLYMYKGKSR